MKRISLTTLALLSPLIVFANPLKVEDDVRAQSSHGIGYLQGRKLAQELLKSGFTAEDFSSTDVAKGFTEAFSGKDSTTHGDDFTVSMEVMKALLLQREQGIAKANLVKSESWISEMKKDKEIKTSESGLSYKVITQGDGNKYRDFRGTEDERLQFFINYEGKTADGTVFERVPAEKAVAVSLKGLPGVTEALKMMHTGSTWELYLTPDKAYGARRLNATVEPNSCIIFKLSLIDIKKKPAKSAQR